MSTTAAQMERFVQMREKARKAAETEAAVKEAELARAKEASKKARLAARWGVKNEVAKVEHPTSPLQPQSSASSSAPSTIYDDMPPLGYRPPPPPQQQQDAPPAPSFKIDTFEEKYPTPAPVVSRVNWVLRQICPLDPVTLRERADRAEALASTFRPSEASQLD